MATDPLTQVLRLVAEGRLTADEAAPILAALDERGPGDGRRERSRSDAGGATSDVPPAGPSTIRLEIREAGRQVVNLRLPIGVGRLALDNVPGLSGDQAERVREALRTGMRGPVVQIEDGDDAVRIVLE